MLLGMYYGYTMDRRWICLPLTTYAQACIIMMMESPAWRSVRRKIRKLFVSPQYKIFTAVAKEQTPVCENTCPICLNNQWSDEFVKTPCSHVYHLYCLTEWMKEKAECPTCRAPLPPIEDE